MISILSSPKAFRGLDQINQECAIRSWKMLHPEIEVILYGDADGVPQASAKLGAACVDAVAVNEQGTPFFSSIIEHARLHARFDVQVYLNADIILTPSFLTSLQTIAIKPFLMVGQRINLPADIRLTPAPQDSPAAILRQAHTLGASLFSYWGVDYFAFPRGLWHNLPQVVIGRGAYDQALIGHCLKRRIPVIDATYSAIVFHQYHGYQHVAGGKEEVYRGQEAQRNLAFLGTCYQPTLLDVPWQLRRGKLVRARGRGDWLRSIECYLRLIRRWERLGKKFKDFRLLCQRRGFSQDRTITLPELIRWFEAEKT